MPESQQAADPHRHQDLHQDLRQHLRQRALGLLARREHSRHELNAKLLRSARAWLDVRRDKSVQAASTEAPVVAIETMLSAVLDELAQRGLQSDARSAEVLVNAKAARWGQRRLQAELQRRGIGDELTEQALTPLAANEIARAAALWQRRFGAAATTPQERARHFRFLAARGFSMDTVQRVLRSAGNASEDDSCVA